jgi:hypothetical protein
MISLISLIIFTLILFSFVLGLLIGKLLLQPQLTEDTLAAYTDFKRDFADFSDRN